ncbi:MAG: dephospho-CoA kinase [Planctomycetia bacterium]|nr:dephospho-CoA kinase [Planctomycetia bacterium]
MKIIALIGGVASGKSAVAGLLRERGAAVLDADAAGHAVLMEPEVEQAARARWGDAIFTAAGHVDRPALGRIVFGQGPQAAAELQYLESLTHPRIRQQLQQQLAALRAEGKHPAVVLDAPVLLKAGWDRLCDTIVFVDAPHAARLARAEARGWSAEEFAAREGAQEPLPEKRAHAHAIIDNSGSLQRTRQEVVKFWDSLFPDKVPD